MKWFTNRAEISLQANATGPSVAWYSSVEQPLCTVSRSLGQQTAHPAEGLCMQCPRCQQDNRDEAKFCRECGLAFGIACATCGSYLRPESKYCDNCGASIPVVAPRHTAPLLLSASPFFHAPSHLAQSIFRSETSQEGERKQVTVLCSDLKGSTEYIAELDPEDARSLLVRCLSFDRGSESRRCSGHRSRMRIMPSGLVLLRSKCRS